MKVLLINPPWYGDDWHGIRAGCRWSFIMHSPKPPADTMGYYNTYPFFMAYAAYYLGMKARIGDVFFYDALAHAHTYEQFWSEVGKIDPDIVIMETSTPSIDHDLEIALKLHGNGYEVAFAGPHATVHADKLIQLPYIDYILKGEYEVSAYEMCLMRQKKVYESRPLMNIDTLSMPFRDNSVLLYADGFGQDQYIEYPQLQVWTSRGCPYRCNYCLWQHTMWTGGVRQRSPRSVTREITYAMKTWGFKSVLLDDDTFNVGDKHTIAIADALDKIAIQWHAMVRPDACSKKAFTIMKQCGCVGLKMGIETFSQNGLNAIAKGQDANQIYETVDFLIDMGFKVFLSMMDDIPHETDEDRAITRERLEYFLNKGASYQHPKYMPLPGTRIYNSLQLEGKIKEKDWRSYGEYYPAKNG